MRCRLRDINKVMKVFLHSIPKESRETDLWLKMAYVLIRLDHYVLMPTPNTMFLFQPSADEEETWELHVSAVRHCDDITRAGKEAVKWMFENTKCQRLIGKPPEGRRDVNLFARRFIKLIGGKPDGDRFVLDRS